MKNIIVKTNSEDERTEFVKILLSNNWQIHNNPITLEVFDDRYNYLSYPYIELSMGSRIIHGQMINPFEPEGVLSVGQALNKLKISCEGVIKHQRLLRRLEKRDKKIEGLEKKIKRLEETLAWRTVRLKSIADMCGTV